MSYDFLIGRKICWRLDGEESIIYGWRLDFKNEIEVQVRSGGPFWSIWFFKEHVDGNDILKDML